MRLHERFDWDRKKATRNLRSHGVSFDDAAAVLRQEDGEVYLVEAFDDEHSFGEERYVTFGAHPQNRRLIVRISWTERTDTTGPLTRVISARMATRREATEYAKEIQNRLR